MKEAQNITQKEHPDLYKRSIKGGAWVFALKLMTQAMGFAKSIIVFNFLFNENLELIVIANMLMAILTAFSESGFNSALVQKKENIEDYLDTAWVISIFRGVILFIIMFLVAPLFASIKANPETVDLTVAVIRAMSFCFLIRSFQNIGIVYFQKEMQFHKTFWLKMAGTITDIVISIIFVVIYKSVWGYVGARLAASIINLFMGYLLCPYRPQFHFIPERAKELWKFGKWLFNANIIGFLLSEGDDWFVLAFLGPDAIKLYRYAYRFSQLPNTHLAALISGVSFPAYSKIQHDLPRLRKAHLKVLQTTAAVSIPMTFMIFTLGPDFVRLFLVEKSHAMIPALQILAAVGMLRSLGSSFWALYVAAGKPYLGLYSNLLRLFLLALIIYPLTNHLGITGTALSVVIVQAIVFPIGITIGSRMLRCPLWFLTRPLCFCFAAASMIAAGIMLVKTFFIKDTSVILFFTLAVGASILYLLVLWGVDNYFKLGYRNIFKEQVSMIARKIRK